MAATLATSRFVAARPAAAAAAAAAPARQSHRSCSSVHAASSSSSRRGVAPQTTSVLVPVHSAGSASRRGRGSLAARAATEGSGEGIKAPPPSPPEGPGDGKPLAGAGFAVGLALFAATMGGGDATLASLERDAVPLDVAGPGIYHSPCIEWHSTQETRADILLATQPASIQEPRFQNACR